MSDLERRRDRVNHFIALYRRLADRLRDVPLPAARLERELLERKLVELREERRALAGHASQTVLRRLGRTQED